MRSNRAKRDIRELRVRCPTCNGRARLWLGGKDYLDCPDCEATGRIPLIEERVRPSPKVFVVQRTD